MKQKEMIIKDFKDMDKFELWNEINLIIKFTNLAEIDKELLIDLIKMWSIK